MLHSSTGFRLSEGDLLVICLCLETQCIGRIASKIVFMIFFVDSDLRKQAIEPLRYSPHPALFGSRLVAESDTATDSIDFCPLACSNTAPKSNTPSDNTRP